MAAETEFFALNDKHLSDYGDDMSPLEAWDAAIKFMEAQAAAPNNASAPCPLWRQKHECGIGSLADSVKCGNSPCIVGGHGVRG